MEIETKLVRRDSLNPTMGSFIDLEYVIHIVERGSLTYQNEEEIFRVGGGDVIVIPPKTLHAITNQQSIDMTVIHFLDRSGRIEALGLEHVIHLPKTKFRDLQFFARAIRNLWTEPNPDSEVRMVCDGLVQAIVGLFCVYSRSEFRSDGKELKFKNWESIKIAVQYIQKNFADPELSVKTICQRVNISYNYFPVLFSKYTNETPLNYINRVRIDYAKTLMFNSTHNITESAFASGFTNLQHFSKIFKQREGMPPSAWLKKNALQ